MINIIQHSWESVGRPSRESPLWPLVENPVDLAFADPPYNYGIDYADDPTEDNLERLDYIAWVDHVVFQLRQMVRDGGILWWLSPAEHGAWLWPMLTKYGSLLHGKPIIFYERFSQYQQSKLTSDYRLLWPLVIGRSKVTFNPDEIREPSVRQEMGDSRADPRGRVPGHVWQVRRLQGTATARVDWHPAQLAPEPLERIVRGWTNEGNHVLDAFAGSGSMGLVCKAQGRRFTGIEQSGEYCEKMRKRLA
jgi:DNA modification methylase